LSVRLKNEYGSGFNKTNLAYMKQFYLTFPILHALSGKSDSKQILHAVSGESKSNSIATSIESSISKIRNFIINKHLKPELSWTHYRFLLKVENKEARDFYIEEAIENNWSTRQLERQINSFYYQRLISSRDKHKLKVEAKKTKEEVLNDEFVKDPYILEFLELKKNTNYFEKDIEKALIDKLQDFLLELGKGFAFVERQQRISADNDNFYIDLVFYNYILKCFVLIDLKAGKLTHQDIGQMDMYVRMYEDLKRSENDNPTIGIILCSEKNDTVIKYSVLKENKQLFASKYMIYMPSEKELKKELEKERMLLNEEKKEK
jgi:predicted nuclease of restriction endonuclease-like (RecB) superfamily